MTLRLNHLLVAVAVLVLSTACTRAPVVDVNHESQTLMAMDAAWSTAAGQKDINKTMSYYANDAIVYPPNMPTASGITAIQKVWSQLMADTNFSLSWTPTAASVAASGDLAVTSGTYKASYLGPDQKVKNETGKYLVVWKKNAGGQWMCVQDIWNADAM